MKVEHEDNREHCCWNCGTDFSIAKFMYDEMETTFDVHDDDPSVMYETQILFEYYRCDFCGEMYPVEVARNTRRI